MYSAGLLKVDTINVSSGTSAKLEATNVTVTNLNATNVSTENLDFNNLNVSRQLKVGDFDYINQNVASNFKTNMDNLNNGFAWDPSINTEVPGLDLRPQKITHPGLDLPDYYYTRLPFTQQDGSFNNIFTPNVCNIWDIGDNERYSFFKGKFRSGNPDNKMDASNTLFDLKSGTKVICALLYARMCTLGVFEQGDPVLVSDYIPALKNINFVVPYYEDFPLVDSSNYYDLSGNLTAWNVKDSSGNPYKVPYNDPSGQTYLAKGVIPPIEKLGIAGKYVNVYKTNRPLYLQDCLAESIGFVCGDADVNGITGELLETSGNNQNFMYGWTAAVNDTSAGYYPDASHEYLWLGNPNGAAAGLKGAGLVYNPIGDIIFNTNNPTGWNNPWPFYRTTNNYNLYPVNKTPLEHINDFFTDFSGQTYMQYFEHGTLNYSSSNTWTPAVLTEAYHRKFPETRNTLDFYEIMHKELFEPVLGPNHSFTYYFDSSGNSPHGNYNWNQIATSWTFNSDPNVLQDLSSYSVSDSDYSINGPTYTGIILAINFYDAVVKQGLPESIAAYIGNLSLQPTCIYQYFTNGTGTNGTGNKANLYSSIAGLISNMNDYMKMIDLLNKQGVYRDPVSGILKRLIRSNDITNISTPKVDTLTQQNLNFSPIVNIYGNFEVGACFAMGQNAVGPSYYNGRASNPNFKIYYPSPYDYPYAENVPLVYFDYGDGFPFDGTSWGGLTGLVWLNFPSKNTTGLIINMADQVATGQHFNHVNANLNVVFDELSLPGSTDIVPHQT